MNRRIPHLIRSFVKCAGLAAVSILVLGPAAANAENQMNAGAMCVAASGGASVDITTLGGIQNNSSTSSMTLVCPVVRGAFSATGSMVGKAFVVDNHYTENVCCSARSRNAGSTSFLFSSDDCTTGVNSYVSLDMVVSGNIGTWDYRYILCTLPPTYSGNKSGISGFRGTEI